MTSALEDLFDRLSLAEADDRFFPVGARADTASDTPRFAAAVRRPYALDVHAEELFDGLLDRRLRRLRMHLERVLAALVESRRSFLRDHRTDHDLVNRRHGLLPLLFVAALLLLRRRLLACGRLGGRLTSGLLRCGFPRGCPLGGLGALSSSLLRGWCLRLFRLGLARRFRPTTLPFARLRFG